MDFVAIPKKSLERCTMISTESAVSSQGRGSERKVGRVVSAARALGQNKIQVWAKWAREEGDKSHHKRHVVAALMLFSPE